MPSSTSTPADCDCTATDGGCPPSTLDVKIAQFEADVEIGHQIVHGDENAVVQTEGGPVPSFANVLSKARDTVTQGWQGVLDSLQGVVGKAYQFERSIVWHVVHNLDCFTFTETIRNSAGQRVIAYVEAINSNELLVHFTEPEEGTITLVFVKEVVITDTV